VGCGVISFSTNILSLTGQRMRYDSESLLTDDFMKQLAKEYMQAKLQYFFYFCGFFKND